MARTDKAVQKLIDHSSAARRMKSAESWSGRVRPRKAPGLFWAHSEPNCSNPDERVERSRFGSQLAARAWPVEQAGADKFRSYGGFGFYVGLGTLTC